MNTEQSKKLFKQASALIPGGVNSPVRACKSVGGDPVFIESAKGSKITDADGNQSIDYIGSWGPMILGHGHPDVMEATIQALKKGASFGAPTRLEIIMAEKITGAVKSMDMVRMVNSGTEATMSAIRLARGFTGRADIIKFDGCYHGHGDSLLVEAGSGVATLGIPGSAGVPDAFVAHTISLPYNDIEAVKAVLNERGNDIACVIVEPVAGNMGLIPPLPGFLEGLREETKKCGALLIFDEVMTGFRVAFGGAQSVYGINPDLTCLGKIIGGGLPVGAYGGKREIMERVAPSGPVYQAGTLSGNPAAMAAGIATLEALTAPGFYENLEASSKRLIQGLAAAAKEANIPAVAKQAGAMLGFFFTDKQDVVNYDDAKTCDLDRFGAWHRGMLENGIYLPPSQFEALFVSAAHSDEDIDETIEAARKVLKAI